MTFEISLAMFAVAAMCLLGSFGRRFRGGLFFAGLSLLLTLAMFLPFALVNSPPRPARPAKVIGKLGTPGAPTARPSMTGVVAGRVVGDRVTALVAATTPPADHHPRLPVPPGYRPRPVGIAAEVRARSAGSW